MIAATESIATAKPPTSTEETAIYILELHSYFRTNKHGYKTNIKHGSLNCPCNYGYNYAETNITGSLGQDIDQSPTSVQSTPTGVVSNTKNCVEIEEVDK